MTALRVLDMEVSVDRASVFNLFIKKFSSPSLLEEYLRSSPYVMDQLKGAQIDEQDLHRAIVVLSEKMKAVDSNAGKKNETSLFTSWTLSFTAPTREEAQKVLAGYIQYISDIVVKETLENIRTSWKSKPATSRKSWRWIGCVSKISLMPIFNVFIIRWKSPTPLALRDRFTVMVRR